MEQLQLILGSSGFRRWIAEVLTWFFLFGGVVGIAVGVSLFLNSGRTLRFFGTMNRWVSMRSTTRPLEIPRDTTRAAHKHRYWLGALFIAGGAFVIYILATQYNARAAIQMFNLMSLRPVVASWIVDSARWILIVGNLVGVGVGILLAFFPAALSAIEVRGGNWFSERRLTKGADNLNLSLDQWVAAHPRGAGAIITVGAVLMIGNFGFMLLGAR